MKFTKIIYLPFFLIFYKVNTVLAQKKNIDSSAYEEWSSVAGANISSNGEYVSYVVGNEPVGSQTLVLRSTVGNWQKKFKGVNSARLLNAKGKDYAIFLNLDDSLVIVSLGKSLVQCIPNVASFSMCRNGESEWITYQLKQPGKELIVLNLNTEKKRAYTGVINNIMGYGGQTVILQIERKSDNHILQELNWVDLSTGKSTHIWEGSKAKDIVLDIKHNQLAFTSERGLFFYNMTIHKLKCLINNDITRLDSGLRFGGIKRFSQDGERLFIDLKGEEKHKPKPGGVEVWSYLDHKLQSQQENEIRARVYAAVVNLRDSKIIRLEQEYENLSMNLFENGSSDTINKITRGAKNNGDWFNTVKYSDYLISLKSGERISLKYPLEGVSPSGKYSVYFDPERQAYISYNTKTRVRRIISKAFSKSYTEGGFDERHRIAGWLDNDEGVLFYDNYDIWRMDLSGQNAPVNLTRGYGKMHHLAFSILYGQSYPQSISTQKIILAAFNLVSKQNGFYSLELKKGKGPELLSMGDYYYSSQNVITMDIDGTGGIPPIKAQKADVYLVSRMCAYESTNYFITKDFITFVALSDVHPERDYNWYRTELHSWTSLDGKTLQGVLYKPENFDPKKKYPVIFHYYESKSNNLNVYIKPEVLSGCCNIDIPTYVSNGYLVFTPDIGYNIGDPMQGTYNAVVSAANYIGSLHFVDSKKMGIQGCSWGGIQTNYLVTHTSLFAAACSTAGIADCISNYGRLFVGNSLNEMYETGQFRMGSSLWEIPDAYIKNSPIFQLDKVTTPFLIMHGKKDVICSYDDAIALLIGLRRLGKKSWMLAYPNENHGISDKKEANDFSIRMMQFFDHYLKDKPAPIWMTRGIPAERRGLDDGLAYDIEIKTPGPGLLIPEEQRKVDSLRTRKPILIELK